MKRPRISIVDDSDADYGIYAWRMSNNKLFKDDHGNILNIPARQYDFSAMKKIRDAALHYGVEEGGQAVFLQGVRRVSEMEYSEQVGRMSEGHIASETDIGAWSDAKRGFLAHGGD